MNKQVTWTEPPVHYTRVDVSYVRSWYYNSRVAVMNNIKRYLVKKKGTRS